MKGIYQLQPSLNSYNHHESHEKEESIYQKDLEKEAKSGVNFFKYWFDDTSGVVFCLSEAFDKPTLEADRGAPKK